MIILSKTLEQVKAAFYGAPIEAGGILGSTGEAIDTFYFDKDNYNGNCYIPNVAKLNAIIKEWAERGIRFMGLIHSHANDCRELSDTDIRYAVEIFKATNYPVYFPIITVNNGNVILTSYIVEAFKPKKDKLKIISNLKI